MCCVSSALLVHNEEATGASSGLFSGLYFDFYFCSDFVFCDDFVGRDSGSDGDHLVVCDL